MAELGSTKDLDLILSLEEVEEESANNVRVASLELEAVTKFSNNACNKTSSN